MAVGGSAKALPDVPVAFSTAPTQSTWSTQGGQKLEKCSQAAVFAQLAWKVAAGGKRSAKVACVQIIGTNGSTVRVVTRAARRANLLKYRINAAML